jgi:hypothetical protein
MAWLRFAVFCSFGEKQFTAFSELFFALFLKTYPCKIPLPPFPEAVKGDFRRKRVIWAALRPISPVFVDLLPPQNVGRAGVGLTSGL